MSCRLTCKSWDRNRRSRLWKVKATDVGIFSVAEKKYNEAGERERNLLCIQRGQCSEWSIMELELDKERESKTLSISGFYMPGEWQDSWVQASSGRSLGRLESSGNWIFETLWRSTVVSTTSTCYLNNRPQAASYLCTVFQLFPLPRFLPSVH